MLTAKVIPDHDAENPLTFCNLGTFAAWHTRYSMGDVQPKVSKEEWLREHGGDGALCLNVWMYEHSGRILSVNDFSDRWDSGHLGYIICTKAEMREAFKIQRVTKNIRKRATDAITKALQVYNDWIEGNCWGFEISDGDETVDSCWGFYGDDLEGMIGNAGEQHRALLTEAWDKRFDNCR